MGYASAMAWVLLLIIAAFTAVNFFASKYWVLYDDERSDDHAAAQPGRPAVPGRRWLTHLALIGRPVVMLYPVLWMVGGSFKDERDIFSQLNPFPSSLDPRRTTSPAGPRPIPPSPGSTSTRC